MMNLPEYLPDAVRYGVGEATKYVADSPTAQMVLGGVVIAAVVSLAEDYFKQSDNPSTIPPNLPKQCAQAPPGDLAQQIRRSQRQKVSPQPNRGAEPPGLKLSDAQARAIALEKAQTQSEPPKKPIKIAKNAWQRFRDGLGSDYLRVQNITLGMNPLGTQYGRIEKAFDRAMLDTKHGNYIARSSNISRKVGLAGAVGVAATEIATRSAPHVALATSVRRLASSLFSELADSQGSIFTEMKSTWSLMERIKRIDPKFQAGINVGLKKACLSQVWINMQRSSIGRIVSLVATAMLVAGFATLVAFPPSLAASVGIGACMLTAYALARFYFGGLLLNQGVSYQQHFRQTLQKVVEGKLLIQNNELVVVETEDNQTDDKAEKTKYALNSNIVLHPDRKDMATMAALRFLTRTSNGQDERGNDLGVGPLTINPLKKEQSC